MIFSEKTGSPIIDAWINVYLLSLGEFELGSFDGPNNKYLWSIFILATFFIQITFLNMLIAIMSNTYDMVRDKQKVAMMRERIEILSEYRDILAIHKPDFQYFFIV